MLGVVSVSSNMTDGGSRPIGDLLANLWAETTHDAGWLKRPAIGHENFIDYTANESLASIDYNTPGLIITFTKNARGLAAATAIREWKTYFRKVCFGILLVWFI